MVVIEGRKYTADEFFSATPKNDSESFELLNGEIVNLASPSTLHQRTVKKVCFEFEKFIQRGKGSCETFMAPFDVKLDSYNVVQPDILIVCDPSKLDSKRCNGAPDLVVEVVSENSTRDYSIKLDLYKKSGVREYWIIDPNVERILVYTFGSVTNAEIRTFDMNVPVGIWNGALEINLKQLLEN